MYVSTPRLLCAVPLASLDVRRKRGCLIHIVGTNGGVRQNRESDGFRFEFLKRFIPLLKRRGDLPGGELILIEIK